MTIPILHRQDETQNFASWEVLGDGHGNVILLCKYKTDKLELKMSCEQARKLSGSLHKAAQFESLRLVRQAGDIDGKVS